MTISRQNVADYLQEQFSALAVAVGQNAAPLTGYKPDIDGALRKLGTAEGSLATATVADSLRDAVFALSEYYAASRFWRQLSDRPIVQRGNTSFSFVSNLSNAEKLMKAAADKCADLGYSVDGRVLRVATFRVY